MIGEFANSIRPFGEQINSLKKPIFQPRFQEKQEGVRDESLSS